MDSTTIKLTDKVQWPLLKVIEQLRETTHTAEVIPGLTAGHLTVVVHPALMADRHQGDAVEAIVVAEEADDVNI